MAAIRLTVNGGLGSASFANISGVGVINDLALRLMYKHYKGFVKDYLSIPNP